MIIRKWLRLRQVVNTPIFPQLWGQWWEGSARTRPGHSRPCWSSTAGTCGRSTSPGVRNLSECEDKQRAEMRNTLAYIQSPCCIYRMYKPYNHHINSLYINIDIFIAQPFVALSISKDRKIGPVGSFHGKNILTIWLLSPLSTQQTDASLHNFRRSGRH